MIDRTALGFDQLKPPGPGRDRCAGPAGQAHRGRRRGGQPRRGRSTLPCGRGPIIAVAGQFVQTVDRHHRRRAAERRPDSGQTLPGGPDRAANGSAGAADQPRRRRSSSTVSQLVGPLATPIGKGPNGSRQGSEWRSDHREVDIPASQASRVLVVPESVNPGWTARTGDGTRLTPVTVNGWQQGWVVPPARRAPITLYLRVECRLPRRDRRRPGPAADPGAAGVGARASPAPARRTGTAVAAGHRAVSGRGACGRRGDLRASQASSWSARRCGIRYVLRNRPGVCDAITVGASAGGLILAGAVLSRYPWRSVDGYVGHSCGRATAGPDRRWPRWRRR